MFFVPLNQVESVELLIHALRAAAGQADCSSCPVRKVCMKQCLTIADSIEKMAQNGTLLELDDGSDAPGPSSPQDEAKKKPLPAKQGPSLKIVK